MIVLFTDVGWSGPYLGQMRLALRHYAPDTPAIDLMHDVPAFDIQAGAYLLAAHAKTLPAGAVILGVVDPGVGGERDGIILQADDRWYVGPENGLFDRVVARADAVQAWRIIWRTSSVSPLFHGRDIFAPVAGMLAAGTAGANELGDPIDLPPRPWPDELARVIFIDRFGNAVTGIRSQSLAAGAAVIVGHHRLIQAPTFEYVPLGDAFWYADTAGLVTLAVNRGRADMHLGLHIDSPVSIEGAVRGSIRPR